MLKNILLVTALIFGKFSFAQCDKTIILKCKKGVEIKNGIPGNEVPFECILTIGGGKVVLTATMNGETQSIEGPITQVVYCNWKELLKNGSAQYKATMQKQEQHVEEALIDIKSEQNYTEVTLGSDPDTGSQLRLIVAEYTIEDAPAPSGKEEQKTVPEKEEKKPTKKKKQKS